MMKAKKLSDIALQSIPKCRRADLFFYHDSQPMECVLILLDKEDKASRGNPSAKFHDRSEILRLSDSLLFCKPESSPHDGLARHLSTGWIPVPSSPNQISNGQPFPSLHSPPLQNVSAAPGTHPLQEPMSPLASEIAGLVRPFH